MWVAPETDKFSSVLSYLGLLEYQELTPTDLHYVGKMGKLQLGDRTSLELEFG